MRNRIFKFRIWDKESRKFYMSSDIYSEEANETNLLYIGSWLDTHINRADYWSCFSKIINQWTGLKDKNKVDIYEGDIVAVYKHYDADIPNHCDVLGFFEVAYFGDKGYPAFDLKDFPIDWGCNALSHVLTSREIAHFEVVGNVYEVTQFAGNTF